MLPARTEPGVLLLQSLRRSPLALPREVNQLGLASLLVGMWLGQVGSLQGSWQFFFDNRYNLYFETWHFSSQIKNLQISYSIRQSFLPTTHFIYFCLVSNHTNFSFTSCLSIGTWWRHSWLRQCAIIWMVVGLIPDGNTGIFHWHNPSGCTMAWGSIQPLTEMSTMNISWGFFFLNKFITACSITLCNTTCWLFCNLILCWISVLGCLTLI